jgi:hypothetical protein
MSRAQRIDAGDVYTFLRTTLDLLGRATLDGADCVRRTNDLRPIVGTLLDLAKERDLTGPDLHWASQEISRRAKAHTEGGGQ